MGSHYVENVCTVLAPGMEYIWRYGAADIQILSTVGSKINKVVWQQDIGGAKLSYGMEVHQVGEL